MWDLPGPGLEPESPALAGGLLTTVPPGKSPIEIFVLTEYGFSRELVVSDTTNHRDTS